VNYLGLVAVFQVVVVVTRRVHPPGYFFNLTPIVLVWNKKVIHLYSFSASQTAIFISNVAWFKSFHEAYCLCRGHFIYPWHMQVMLSKDLFALLALFYLFLRQPF